MYIESASPPAVGDLAAEVSAPGPFAGVPERLHAALRRRGFDRLTEVQRAMVAADDGARDLRISSQTGSGKTVALGFALAEGLVVADRRGPTTLILAPTRELAMQVKEELAWLFADLEDVACEVVTGGTSIARERTRLKRRPVLLVATPGRLLDHVRAGALDLSSVHQLVLDEADQMLDLGFKDELDEILLALPGERRTHLVSATFPRAVLDLVDRFQKRALLVAGQAPGTAHADIEHVALRIHAREHYGALVNLLLLAGDERTLVFVRTREDTTTLADKLAVDGFAALPINGELAQAQRTRTLAAFKNGTISALIATDVAARGLDIQDVTTVVHVDPPIDAATYVHRSGRTGRAGQKGKSVMLVLKSYESRTRRLYNMAKVTPTWAFPPGAATIAERQLRRAEEHAAAAIAAHGIDDSQRRVAAHLLQGRDPIEVVAALLRQAGHGPREPFPFADQPDQPMPAAPRAAPATAARAQAAQAAADDDRAPRRAPLVHRGRPGAPPAWQQRPRAAGSESGFTRFSINWGTRGGADARRILAHVCRRGGIDSDMVGAIDMHVATSTFDVADAVAAGFARRVEERDRRDPHLVIKRAGVRRAEPQPHERGDATAG